ncbi:hypothetical protein BDZ89DRAFT_1129244 [Hymenopellis radicata]|nr:hypothetical protein BDZ89DRAFT_1129244 [Hymenopellis radicata]
MSLKSPSYQDSGSSFRSSQMSATSKFRESTYVIPSRVPEDERYKPFGLTLFVAIGTTLVMLSLGVALEVGIILSNRNNGFAVPERNVLSFASNYFLLSFVPTLIIIPFAMSYRELDWYIRWYQSYVVLQRGNVNAEEGLLTDYVSLGPFYGLFYSRKYKHRVIFWSAFTALITYIFQPLAGSLFSIQQMAIFSNTTITSTRTISLSPDVNDLNAFVSAAGFADAAVFNGLSDPPFVTAGWATAEFAIPQKPGLNGTVIVDTTGVETIPNCENALNATVGITNGNVTIHSTSVSGCQVDVPINTTLVENQYGVVDTGCGDDLTLNVTLQPVMFWYFHRRVDNNVWEAKTVFCSPSIKMSAVHAEAWLQSKTIASCQEKDELKLDNNITGSPLFGKAFNGVVFPASPDPFVQARATATNTGVPGAIFRFASQLEGGPQSTFDLPNGFLDITSKVYTLHLALAAKNIYFVAENTTLPAQIQTFVPRLVISALPGHTLAILMFLVGLIGTFLHIISRRQRRQLFLSCPPGTIGSIIAMTSHSGFGQLLVPYDTHESIEKKLDGLRFRLDQRTGAIVADDEEDVAADGRDAALQSLLGRKNQRSSKDVMRMSSLSVSSSQTAYQAATGYPPWRGPASPLRTPYDPL